MADRIIETREHQKVPISLEYLPDQQVMRWFFTHGGEPYAGSYPIEYEKQAEPVKRIVRDMLFDNAKLAVEFAHAKASN